MKLPAPRRRTNANAAPNLRKINTNYLLPLAARQPAARSYTILGQCHAACGPLPHGAGDSYSYLSIGQFSGDARATAGRNILAGSEEKK